MDYEILFRQLQALTEDCPYRIANLANTAALLWQALEDINWAGFYELKGEQLVLGPFQGKPACIRIPMGKGVCGSAAATGSIQRVEDVHQFPGHIACDSASNSEIVLPLYENGSLWGVLDIDSPRIGRFSQEDQQGLSRIAEAISDFLGKSPL